MSQRPVYGTLLFVALSCPSEAQFFGHCESGSTHELASSIEAHQEHMLRLSNKFENVWYAQGAVAKARAGLRDFHRYLARLRGEGRNTGILYYSYAPEESRSPGSEPGAPSLRLCTWLITAGGVLSNVAKLEQAHWLGLQPRLRAALGFRGGGPAGRSEESRSRGEAADEEGAGGTPDASAVVGELSEILLPPPVSDAILVGKIDTLLVVPVTLTIPQDEKRDLATRMVAAIGTVPFSALRLGKDRKTTLVDVASVVIAPGFAALADATRKSARRIENAIIVGDPSGTLGGSATFPQLREARKEAEEVAASLGTRAIVGPEATKKAVLRQLETAAGTTGFIHFATHGVADTTNPLDGSYLVLSDDRLTAREVSRLRLEKNPLVVMSACDTGLGKSFEVGTIGLARAWQHAGASTVVMSLWKIDDAATRQLVTTFVQFARSEPPDRALQRAIQKARLQTDDLALWASLATFGLPEPPAHH